MGYDRRVAGVFTSLGYHVFPFEAFDDAGRLLLPDSLKLPSRWTQAVGRVQAAPAWNELYPILSVLDNLDPAWRSFMAGVAYLPGQVRVMVVKGNSTVAGSEAANSWARAYHDVISASVRNYAGAVTPLDPGLVAPLSELTDYLKNQSGGATPNPEEPKKTSRGPSPAAVEPDPGDDFGPAGVAGWAALGAGALLQLVRALSTISFAGRVLSTVLWFPPQPMTAAQQWAPIHVDYTSSGRRSLHMVWNPNVNTTPKTPRIIYGSEIAWRGWGVIDAPHDPWQMCQAFDPTANCGHATLLQETSEGSVTVAASTTDRPEVPDGPMAATGLPTDVNPVALVGHLVRDGASWRLRAVGDQADPGVIYVPMLQRAFHRNEDGRYSVGATTTL